jgi:hypothetical protein
MLDLLLFGVALAMAAVLLRPALRDLPMWRATVTPLASIIGSGFLIAGPLLAHIVGPWAPVAMLGILVAAFSIGSIIRFNIAHGESLLARSDCPVAVRKLQQASNLALALAYVVSVAFYVRLLASFVLRFTAVRDSVVENGLTTAVLLSMASVRWLQGLGGLQYSGTNNGSVNPNGVVKTLAHTMARRCAGKAA